MLLIQTEKFRVINIYKKKKREKIDPSTPKLFL